MLPEEKGHIDDLFKSGLDKFEIEASSDQFDQMEIGLERMRYFKFSLRHFNIYYSSLIVFCFVFSTVAVVRSFEKEELPEQQKIYILSDSTQTSQLIESQPVLEKPRNHKLNPVKRSSGIRTPEATPMPDSMPAPTPVVVPPIIPSAPKDSLSNAPPKPKRIKYVNKRDTIIRYDTTKVIKKR